MADFTKGRLTDIEVDGVRRLVRVARLTNAELAEFRVDRDRFRSRQRRGVPVRKPGEETLRDEEVWALRDSEAEEALEPEARERVWRNRRHEARAETAYVQRILTDYVQVTEPWTTRDGVAIASGADIANEYGHLEWVTTQCELAILTCNTLTEDERKNLPSLPDLLRGLRDKALGRTGEKPDVTADSAEQPDSADRVDAMASTPSSEMPRDDSPRMNTAGSLEPDQSGTRTPETESSSQMSVLSSVSPQTSTTFDGGLSKHTSSSRLALVG
jgi:hypothetical protein